MSAPCNCIYCRKYINGPSGSSVGVTLPRLPIPSSPSYTAGELTTLAQRFLQQSPLTDKLAPELILSSFLVWLAKREREKEDGG